MVLSHGGPVTSLAVLPDGRLASGGGADGKIKLWPKDFTGEPVVRHAWQLGLSLAALADGRLASGGTQPDGKIKLWPKDGSGRARGPPYGRAVFSLAVLADGRLASGGDQDSKITLWRTDGTFNPERSPLISRRAIKASRHFHLRYWRTGGWPAAATMARSPSGARTSRAGPRSHAQRQRGLIAGGPAGRAAASGGNDGEIKLWQTDDAGKHVVLTQGSEVRSLVVLADGRLASGGSDGRIKLWPKDFTGEPVVLMHGGPVTSLVLLKDGRLASGGFDDGKIRLWLVGEEEQISALCLRAGHNLSKNEWARYIGSDTPWQPSCRQRASKWSTSG